MGQLVPFLAFGLACLAVALVWSIVASLWSSHDVSLADFLRGLAALFALVVATAALPAAALFVWARRRGMVTYRMAILGGIVIGASLFLALFSTWISGSRLYGIAELIALGGGLGGFGGLVFMFSRHKLARLGHTS